MPPSWLEVDNLYKKAQKILLHEMTQDEQLLVTELAFENHETLSDDKLFRLKELVRNKGDKLNAER
jgi:hypothetical protein